jgi:hypothetical protein
MVQIQKASSSIDLLGGGEVQTTRATYNII